MLNSLALQRRTAVKDGGSEVAARQASQPVRGEKIKICFAKAHLFARQGGERGAERLNVFAVVGR